MQTENELVASAALLASRYVRGNAGGVLMRCPACHQSRYVSEFVVFVRQEVQRCPVCSGQGGLMEPVRDYGAESAVSRLRAR